MGNLTDCSCDVSRNGIFNEEGWQWGGCSDNVAYGVKIGKQFVDAAEDTGSKVRNAMNLHNNEVGRQVKMSLLVISLMWSLRKLAFGFGSGQQFRIVRFRLRGFCNKDDRPEYRI